MKRINIISVVVGLVCATLSDNLFAWSVSSGAVVPGEWNSSFSKAKAYADANNVPMLVFWGNVGCGNCGALRRSCDTDEFKEWQAERKIVMIFDETPNSSAKNFARNSSGQYPYMCVYWLREDGSATTNRFSGLRASMPAPSVENGETRSLAMQLAASVDMFIGDYRVSDYEGGEFKTSVYADSRLEAVPGRTLYVDVPLKRSMANAVNAASTFCVATIMPDGSSFTNEVSWAAGALSQTVKVEIPEAARLGGEIELELVDENGKARSKSVIALVEDPENSVRNPQWLTDDFEFGKWTLNYDAATNAVENILAQNTNAYTLALFSGTLWCPYCKGIESSLFASQEFKDWAYSNNVALVLFDQGRASSPSTAAGSDISRLLTYEADPKADPETAVSGAGYLSRNMISVDDAQSVIALTTKLTSEWLQPGSSAARLSNPTLLLIKNGNVVGRFAAWRDDQRSYDVKENIGRLNDFLSLASRDGETDDFPVTSKRVLKVGSEASSTFQISDRNDYFKLYGVAAGRLEVALKARNSIGDVVFSLLQNDEVVGTGTNSLSAAVSAAMVERGGFVLRVSAYDGMSSQMLFNPQSGAAVETTIFNVAFASTQKLIPEEKATRFSPGDSKVSMELKEGFIYRLEGFPEGSLESGFEKVEGAQDAYKARQSGVVEIACAEDNEILYQIWKPGTIGFTVVSRSEKEDEKEIRICIARREGSSGAIKALVELVNGDEVEATRYDWEDVEIEWADGETSEKEAVLHIHDDWVCDGNQTLKFRLSLISGESVKVGNDSCDFTIEEDDRDIIGKLKISGTEPIMSKKMTVVAAEGSAVKILISRINGARGAVAGMLTASAGMFNASQDVRCQWADRDRQAERMVELSLPTLSECPAGKVTVKLAGDGISVDSQAKTLTIMLVSDDAPVFTEEEVVISDLVSNVAFERTLEIDQNSLIGNGSVKVSKISGTQPAGVKVSLITGSAALKISGVPTKAGDYQAFYRVSQIRNGKTVNGGVVKVSYSVAELTKGDNPVNPAVAKSFTLKNVPVFAATAKRMTGLLTLTVPASGRLSAKYLCSEGSISLSCSSWAECDENGTLKAELRSRNYAHTVAVSVASSGKVTAEVTDPQWPGDTITASASSGDIWGKNNTAAAWKGVYTVALIPTEVVKGAESIVASGAAGFSVKLTSASALRNGTASYAGFLPNGTSVSGSAMIWKSEDGRTAVLPIFHTSITDVLTAAALISKNAADLYGSDEVVDSTVLRVVNAIDGVNSFWNYRNRKTEIGDFEIKYSVYGSYYVPNGDIESVLKSTAVMPTMSFDVDTEMLGASDVYGEVGEAPHTSVSASGKNISSESSEVKLTFDKSTGMVSGSFALPFAEKNINAKYRAVVLPGWTGCGCEDRIDLPYLFIGSCWFDDVFKYQEDWESCSEPTAAYINVKIKRGCAVSAETVPYSE